MASAQQVMEEQANKSRSSSPLLHPGDKVWLNLKNIETPQQKKKLAWKNAKKTTAKIISSHIVELDIRSKIWPRVHVDLLRRARNDPLLSQQDNSQ